MLSEEYRKSCERKKEKIISIAKKTDEFWKVIVLKIINQQKKMLKNFKVY